MKNILLNLKMIDQSTVKKTDKGNEFIALKMVKLKTPTGRVTHLLFHKNDSKMAKTMNIYNKKYVGTGCGYISPTIPVSENDDANFYMLFVEGGKVPVYKHLSREDARKQAEVLSQELQQRVYVLAPVEFMDYHETPIDEMIQQTEDLDFAAIADEEIVFGKTEKKQRKRIPIKQQ